MAAYHKFDIFVADLANGVHNLGANALKVLLSAVAPVAGNTVLVNITQIAAGNGYSAGGAAVTVTGSTQVGGLYTLTANDVVFTAGPAAMAAFQYVTLYNSTPAAGPLIGWWDYGSAITVLNTQTFTVHWATGILTIQ